LLRTLIGLVLGVVLFVLGVPTLISLNRRFGIHSNFGYDQAVLGMLLVLACILVVQLSGPRPPAPPSKSKD
jgi:hypothetical protein